MPYKQGPLALLFCAVVLTPTSLYALHDGCIQSLKQPKCPCALLNESGLRFSPHLEKQHAEED